MMIGLSQEKLASGLGLTFQQVQKYERGTNRVGASRLQHIAGILNVPISYFFAESANSSSTKPTDIKDVDALTAFLSSQQGVELNRAFVKLENLKLRKRIVQLVTAIARNEGASAGFDDGTAKLQAKP